MFILIPMSLWNLKLLLNKYRFERPVLEWWDSSEIAIFIEIFLYTKTNKINEKIIYVWNYSLFFTFDFSPLLAKLLGNFLQSSSI